MSDARIEGGLPRAGCADLTALLAEILGTDAPDLPLAAPVMLLGKAGMTQVAQAFVAPQGLAALHEFQRIERLGPWPLDRPLDAHVTAQSGHVTVAIHGPNGPAAHLETRIRFAAPAQVQALKGACFADRMAGAGTRWTALAPMTQAMIDRYLALSGDANPIHRDAAAAQAAGFGGVIVPGMVLAALAEAALARGAHPPHGMTTRFMAPVRVGESLDMAAVPRGAGARVFTLTKAGIIAAITDLQ